MASSTVTESSDRKLGSNFGLRPPKPLKNDSSSSENEGDSDQGDSPQKKRKIGENSSLIEDPKSVGAKKKSTNCIWADILTDQTLSQGLNQEVSVGENGERLERGAESYEVGPGWEDKKRLAKEKEKKRGNHHHNMKSKGGWRIGKPSEHNIDAPNEKEDLDMELEEYATGVDTKKDDEKDLFADDHSEAPVKEMGTKPSTSKEAGHKKERSGALKRGGKDKKWLPPEKFRARLGTKQKALTDDIKLSSESPPDKLGPEIATLLREPKTRLMIHVVKTLGAERAIQIYNETEQVESTGGIMTIKGDRRRSPGGVFLYLMKMGTRLSEDEKKSIFEFEQEHERKHEKVKRKRKQKAITDTFQADLEEMKEALARKQAKLKKEKERLEQKKKGVIQTKEEKVDGKADETEDEVMGESKNAEDIELDEIEPAIEFVDQ